MSDKYLEMFIQESRENLDRINDCLLVLEKQPDHKDIVDEVFRAAHTLKGMAGSMQFKEMNKLTHSMENVLDNIRNGSVKVDDALIDLLFDCLDLLETHLNSIINNSTEVKNDNKLLGRLDAVIKSKGNDIDDNIDDLDMDLDDYQTSVLEKAIEQGMDCYRLKITIEKDCKLKAARAYLIFKNIEKYSQTIKTVPDTEEIEKGNYKQDLYLWIIVDKDFTAKEIKNQIINISEIENVDIVQIKKEELIKNERIKTEKNSGKSRDNKINISNTIRVDISRLDAIMNQVSELIIVKNRIEELTSRGDTISDTIERLGNLTAVMHDSVMKLRMVPLNVVFNRFPRTVRDLSKKTGKKVELIIEGADTEVDKTIADSISEPLIHIIRNSIDHGIESSDKRSKLGKDEVGKIKIDAFYEGNDVVIQVSDDGGGIETENVLKKAIQKGLIEKSDAQTLTKHQIVDMLFAPGFSTSDEVSDISGRGVGLDVVKSKIETLGGNVEVESIDNAGTQFTIRLPLTLAIIQALLINQGNQKYAIPLNSVKEIVAIKASDVKNINNTDVFSLRGRLIPMRYVDRLLGIDDTVYDDEMIALVVKKNKKLYGLVISELLQEQEIVVKSIGNYLSKLKIFSGATILGDGKPALILDTNYLC
ncbi:MAG: chemotaxis protein CheA [Clostridia bacterium]|nr:chemotaxis protein CheA [Clostridia bacterium]